MLTIWGRATSANVMKILWALDELGTQYRRIDAGGPYGATDSAGFRAMSPLGLVPCLQDDDFSLCESNAILRYLCNRDPAGASLYPTEPQARAGVDALLDIQQSALAAPADALFRALRAGWSGARDAAETRIAAAQCASVWAALEPRLAQQKFLAGDILTIADISFGPALHQWLALDVPDRPTHPHLRRWYARLQARTPFRVHVAECFNGRAVPLLRPAAPSAPRGWFRYDPAASAIPAGSRAAVMSPARTLAAV